MKPLVLWHYLNSHYFVFLLKITSNLCEQQQKYTGHRYVVWFSISTLYCTFVICVMSHAEVSLQLDIWNFPSPGLVKFHDNITCFWDQYDHAFRVLWHKVMSTLYLAPDHSHLESVFNWCNDDKIWLHRIEKVNISRNTFSLPGKQTEAVIRILL